MSEPQIILIIVGAVALFFLIWFVANYNALVRLKLHVKESWADVETELKRRHDLIPNLVETVKGYATHEERTLQAVTEARSRAQQRHDSPDDQARDENRLGSALNHMMVVAEAYPDLKADNHFLALQKELATTENRIQAARRFYNANVRDNNTRCQVIPSNIIASMFGFKVASFFEIDDPAERAVPEVKV
jgi:LemA protein